VAIEWEHTIAERRIIDGRIVGEACAYIARIEECEEQQLEANRDSGVLVALSDLRKAVIVLWRWSYGADSKSLKTLREEP